MIHSTLETNQLAGLSKTESVFPAATLEVNRLFRLTAGQHLLRACLRTGSAVMPRLTAELAYQIWSKPRRRKQHKLIELPSGGMPFEIPHRGRMLRGLRWGITGPKILLVHGWESHLGRMSTFVEPLLDAGYQVLALDGPGHGRSDHWVTNAIDFGDGLKSLIIEVGGIDGLVAHSFGASAALFMFERNLNLLPNRLVCIAPMVHMRIHLRIFQSLSAVSNQVLERMEEMITKRIGVNCSNWHLLDIPRRLNRPGLIIHDIDDQVVSPCWSDQLLANWPKGSLVSTRGLGHNRILKDAMVVERVTRFFSTSGSA
ncbi:MAG: alpha/beta hydrolase [Chloroflexota bacterium]